MKNFIKISNMFVALIAVVLSVQIAHASEITGTLGVGIVNPAPLSVGGTASNGSDLNVSSGGGSGNSLTTNGLSVDGSGVNGATVVTPPVIVHAAPEVKAVVENTSSSGLQVSGGSSNGSTIVTPSVAVSPVVAPTPSSAQGHTSGNTLTAHTDVQEYSVVETQPESQIQTASVENALPQDASNPLWAWLVGVFKKTISLFQFV